MKNEGCARFTEELSEWLDSAWDTRPSEIPTKLSQHADGCSRCHRELLLARRLIGQEHEPPDGLSDAVVERLAIADGPRARRLMPSLAVAAMCVVALGLGLLMGTARNKPVVVELTLHAPDAASVSVVGDWNGWDPLKDPLTDSDDDGVWRVELRLASGADHMYQFVIDQKTRTPDPLALVNIDDGFGGLNSVLNL